MTWLSGEARVGATSDRGPLPTLSDVARLAGVSAMTASRVINGNVAVTRAKRELVEAAVHKLGYVPNKAARALSKTGASASLAFAFRPDEAGPLMAMVDSGLDEASECQVDLSFLPVKSGESADLLVRRAVEAGVAGMILAEPLCERVELYAALRGAGIRVLALGQAAAGVDCSSVRIDEQRASYELTANLLRAGHRRIGFIGRGAGDERSALRHAGFAARMQQADASYEDAVFWTGGTATSDLIGAVEAALKSEPPLTAVVACDPGIVLLLLGSGAEHAADAASALLVCGFEHDSVAWCGASRSTAVQLPSNEMARLAVRQLADEVAASRRGHVVRNKHILVDHAVFARSGASFAKPRHAALLS